MVGAGGSVMAPEAVKLVTGAGEPLLGRLLVLDALAMTWRTVTVRPDPYAAPVTSLTDAAAACAPAPPALGPDAVVDAPTLARWLQTGDVDLVDVRGEEEAALVSIPGSRVVPLPRILSGDAVGDLPRDRRTVLYCKSGVRSAQALQVLRGHGFDQVVHLDGGVLAWVRDVDPTLPTY